MKALSLHLSRLNRVASSLIPLSPRPSTFHHLPELPQYLYKYLQNPFPLPHIYFVSPSPHCFLPGPFLSHDAPSLKSLSILASSSSNSTFRQINCKLSLTVKEFPILAQPTFLMYCFPYSTLLVPNCEQIQHFSTSVFIVMLFPSAHT